MSREIIYKLQDENCRKVKKLLYDNLVYDFRTKRHLKENYDLISRVAEILRNNQPGYYPNGYCVVKGVLKYSFYRNYSDAHKRKAPFDTLELDTNKWASTYKVNRRDKRLKKIINKIK